jgi:flagellar biosynthetic protein FliO
LRKVARRRWARWNRGVDGSAWVTVVLLGALCVAALLARRALGRRGATAGGMRVVGRLGIEPRRSLVLVEAGGRRFLVGVGEGPMTLLAELEAEADPNFVPLQNKQAGLNVNKNIQAGLNVSESGLLRAWRRVIMGGGGGGRA